MGKLLIVANIVVCRCVLELHAIAKKKNEGGGEFAVAMTTEERLRFLQGIVNHGEYNKMLGTVNAETSGCSRIDDRRIIHDCIREKIGFGQLNRMVIGVIEEWMDEQLQAQVAVCEKAGKEMEVMKWKATRANFLSDQGRHNGALALKEQVLELCRRILPNDPATGESFCAIACLLILTRSLFLMCRLSHEQCRPDILCTWKTQKCPWYE